MVFPCSKGKNGSLKALKCFHNLSPILTGVPFGSLALHLYFQQSLNTVSPVSVKRFAKKSSGDK